MPRKTIILAASLICCSVFGSIAEAAFVTRNTLRPRDAAKSVRAVVADVTSGALTLDSIEGIHHPRTIGKAQSQANMATIYARVSGELPARIPSQPPQEFDQDFLTVNCEQLEDDRWICSTLFLEALISLTSPTFDYFFLER